MEALDLKEEEIAETEEAEKLRDGNENEEDEEEPSNPITVNVSNVVCHFITRCHLNLRTLCRQMWNVEHNTERNQVTMQLRKPACYVHIRPSGNITCFGFRNDTDALIGARRVARLIARAGFPVRFVSFRVVNVMANVQLPFRIDLDRLNTLLNETPLNAQATEESEVDFSLVRSYIYEPELHPAATLKLTPDHNSKREVTFQTFSSGALSILAPNCASIFATLPACVPLLASCKFDPARSSGRVECEQPNMYSNAHNAYSSAPCLALLDHSYARPRRLIAPLSSNMPVVRRIAPARTNANPIVSEPPRKRIRVLKVHDALGLDSDVF